MFWFCKVSETKRFIKTIIDRLINNENNHYLAALLDNTNYIKMSAHTVISYDGYFFYY